MRLAALVVGDADTVAPFGWWVDQGKRDQSEIRYNGPTRNERVGKGRGERGGEREVVVYIA